MQWLHRGWGFASLPRCSGFPSSVLLGCLPFPGRAPRRGTTKALRDNYQLIKAKYWLKSPPRIYFGHAPTLELKCKGRLSARSFYHNGQPRRRN
ncbi:hypothetical protein L209DRAFT_238670 [Thermothelomyces heterothallicus CBS 203.75]